MRSSTRKSQAFCQKFALEKPIIQAPMAGGPTTPELVAAISNAGGLGSIGAGYIAPEALRDAIQATRSLTDKPFQVNLFAPGSVEGEATVMPPAADELRAIAGELGLKNYEPVGRFTSRFQEQIDVVVDESVPIVSFVFGFPDKELQDSLVGNGAMVVVAAGSRSDLADANRRKFDAVVAQGYEAGGHRGGSDITSEPIGLMSLLQYAARECDIPVVAAGGIASGGAVAASLILGASAVQIGSLFLLADEAGVSESWKEALITSTDTSTHFTTVFSGRPARGIRNEFVRRLESYANNLPPYPLQNAVTTPIRRAAGQAGQADFMSLWSGQTASLGHRSSARDLLQGLLSEFEEAMDRFE